MHGWFLRYVMFHELAHYMFHMPSQAKYGAEFFSLHSKEKNHIEAESVAALLLLPMHELTELLQLPEVAHDEHIKDLIGVRLKIASRYRI